MEDSDWSRPDDYAAGQWARAFVTSITHEDAATRERAVRRTARWAEALRAMASGRVVVGVRAPVVGLPTWATPVVLRGGFASGAAAAGPLPDHERALAAELGLPAKRAALFEHHLTEAGLSRLWGLLDTGCYRVGVPEQAALLVVAQLVRTGAVPAALALAAELRPYARRLGFLPEPADTPLPDPSVVSRETAGQVRAALAARKPNPRVAAQTVALTVWSPLVDGFVELWRDETAPDWAARATELVARCRALADEYPLTRRLRDPHSNLAVLRDAAEQVLAGHELDARRRGLVQARVEAAVRKRGVPGSAAHAALRQAQAVHAAAPSHHVLAGIAARRLAAVDDREALTDPDAYAGPAAAGEAPGVAPGTPMPVSVRRALARATGAQVEELVARGIVPSGEVLAELVPRITAAAIARAYPDPPTRALVAATEAAFRRRRSVLITDLSSQVRADELPWLRALAPYRSDDAGVATDLRGSLNSLAGLALDAFPGTILPNPLVEQLRALSRAAGLQLPWVAEIAADIFTGQFVQAFPDGARLAQRLLAGTPYARYYALEGAGSTPAEFAARCRRRAGVTEAEWSVAANGRVLEQAQILTTHDLILLAGPLGVVPAAGWEDAARRSYAHAARLLVEAGRARKPLRLVKNAAYAWRQAIFHLSLAGPDAQRAFPAWEERQAVRVPPAVLDGLAVALDGGTPGEPFLGWTLGPHPLVAVATLE